MSSKGGKGAGKSSILDYFSKSARKKDVSARSSPSSTFGTPATPSVGHAAGESGTPVSEVIDDAFTSGPDGRQADGAGGDNAGDGTPASSAMGSTTPDTCEPSTPPSPTAGETGVVLKSRRSTETPPSNDTEMTTPQSPPTPDTWMESVIDRKENASNNRKRVLHRNKEYSSKKSGGEAADTPISLLEDASLLPTQKASRTSTQVNMGTPSTACTPRAASSTHDACTSTLPSNQQIVNATKKQKRSNQMFLDFGQNSFGKQTICNICGMLRVHGLDEDDAQHAKVCKDYKEGVSCSGWKNERAVGTFGKDDRVLEVRPEDAQQHRRKVVEVKAIVDKELGFARRQNEEDSSSDGSTSLTSYMYISKKRVVGLLVVKRIHRAYELMPQNGDADSGKNTSCSISRSLKRSKALLGVHQIWVHKGHRHRGIASKLVTAARDNLIFGMVVPLELVAFSSPTEDGLRFAKGYVGSDTPLIYDIH